MTEIHRAGRPTARFRVLGHNLDELHEAACREILSLVGESSNPWAYKLDISDEYTLRHGGGARSEVVTWAASVDAWEQEP